MNNQGDISRINQVKAEILCREIVMEIVIMIKKRNTAYSSIPPRMQITARPAAMSICVQEKR